MSTSAEFQAIREIQTAMINLGQAFAVVLTPALQEMGRAATKLHEIFWSAYLSELPPGEEPSEQGFEKWLARKGEALRRQQEAEREASHPLRMGSFVTDLDNLINRRDS